MRACALAVVAMTACGTPSPSPPPTSPAAAPLHGVVAHRGASREAPENTIAALRRAWELGCESAEIDVRVTADQQVVLMHDADTQRTGGRARAVADQTLAELKQLDVGAWKDARYRGERVPTLGEALDATPPGRMLFVEIKTSAADAEVVAAAIRAAAPEKRGAVVALQAYDAEALRAVGERLPGVETYWTVDPPQDGAGNRVPYPAALARTAAEMGLSGVAVHHAFADDALVAAVADARLILDVWTVNDGEALARWRTRARWVETDEPALAR